MCLSVTRGTPLSIMISGRHTRPPSAAMLHRPGSTYTLTKHPMCPARRRRRKLKANWAGWRCSPRMWPFKNTSATPGEWISAPITSPSCSTPRVYASLASGTSSSSVVTCVISARFLTRPQASPSGVSEGHNMPHWEGCRARGPDTLRVFSNCDVMRVIMPSAEMYDSRFSTCVTPLRSMRKRLTVQFPEEMACSSPCDTVS
mmetsp:Transcript_98/g.181  ORF Transcript_98/g.181 Transcript_98/m.181 type:complete len:202 (-) Transcript_98:1792-2397(-)